MPYVPKNRNDKDDTNGLFSYSVHKDNNGLNFSMRLNGDNALTGSSHSVNLSTSQEMVKNSKYTTEKSMALSPMAQEDRIWIQKMKTNGSSVVKIANKPQEAFLEKPYGVFYGHSSESLKFVPFTSATEKSMVKSFVSGGKLKRNGNYTSFVSFSRPGKTALAATYSTMLMGLLIFIAVCLNISPLSFVWFSFLSLYIGRQSADIQLRKQFKDIDKKAIKLDAGQANTLKEELQAKLIWMLQEKEDEFSSCEDSEKSENNFENMHNMKNNIRANLNLKKDKTQNEIVFQNSLNALSKLIIAVAGGNVNGEYSLVDTLSIGLADSEDVNTLVDVAADCVDMGHEITVLSRYSEAQSDILFAIQELSERPPATKKDLAETREILKEMLTEMERERSNVSKTLEHSYFPEIASTQFESTKSALQSAMDLMKSRNNENDMQ